MMWRFIKDILSRSTSVSCRRNSLYEQLGGERFTARLSRDFYDNIWNIPEVARLKSIHHAPREVTEEKFRMFLSGWLGGPALYEQTYGHPRLRQRHLPFTVDQQLRDQWMFCMQKALASQDISQKQHDELLGAFAHLASMMINQPATNSS